VSRVLFTWELGGGYGHLAHILPLANALRARGHECTLALRDLSRVGNVAGTGNFRLLQAPVWLPTAVGMPPPASYAEILLRFGYLDPRWLRALAAAWRSLYALASPDLLVFNHSPTAMLAASGLGIPTATLETGFSGPPRTKPLPAMRWWAPDSIARLRDSEQRVLRTVNSIRAECGGEPCAGVADLLAADEQFLCTFRELDHYPQREPGARYVGPVFTLETGIEPPWPTGGGPRVFAYVNAGFRDLEPLLKALAGLRGAALVHAPGIAPVVVARHRGPHLEIVAEPVHVGAVRATCDAAVCHGPGTAAAILLAGKPLLLLPTQLEQYMAARRIADLGAGIAIGPEVASADYAGSLRRLLTEPAIRQAAEGVAAAHAGFDQPVQVGSMADRCEALLGRRARGT
jgi:UDP:flavonoid glycosyltransferase YjiC (YdhE family)